MNPLDRKKVVMMSVPHRQLKLLDMKISPPANVTTKDWPASRMWTDEFGILICVAHKIPAGRSLEETKKTMDEFKASLNGKKVCLLIDVTEISDYPKEIRNYAADEFPKLLKAVAMVSNSALGKMMANLFFTLKKQPYPTKMFYNEQDARNWLKQYL